MNGPLKILIVVSLAMATALAASAQDSAPAPEPRAEAKSSDVVSEETTIRETQAMGADASRARANQSDTTAKSTPPPATVAASTEPTTPARAANWWKDTDADGDGKISAAEAQAAGNAGLHARFDAIDADKDGFVKLEEYRTYFESTVGKTPR